MTVVLIPLFARPPLQTNRYIRNGLYPDALATTFMQEETNRILHQRPKSWSFFTPIDAVPATAGAGARTRWRAFIHTSSLHSYMQIRLVVASAKAATTNPYADVRFSLAGSALIDSEATLYYGSGDASDVDAPDFFGGGDTTTETSTVSHVIDTLTPDQDYEVSFVDYDGARIVSACMWEIAKLVDTDNGYIQSGVQAGSPIFDEHREDMVTLLRTAWKRNAGPLITWSVTQDSAAVTSATAISKNVVDTSVTTVSGASPGFTVDLRYRSTVRRASLGVPCRMRAYHKGNAGTVVGNVLLKDSTGATLATCTTSSTTAAWTDSGLFYMPATLAKYDLQLNQTNIGTHTLYAASIYQMES